MVKAARPTAVRRAASAAVRGGMRISQISTARPAAARMVNASTVPTVPVLARRCPGNGLAAGDATAASPVGNNNTCSTNARGTTTSTGTVTRSDAVMNTAVKRASARTPSRVVTTNARTTTAGAAMSVALATSAQTIADQIGRSAAASAVANTIRPTIARSGPAVVDVSAVNGNTTASCAPRSGTEDTRSSRRLAMTQTAATTRNTSRASVSTSMTG